RCRPWTKSAARLRRREARSPIPGRQESTPGIDLARPADLRPDRHRDGERQVGRLNGPADTTLPLRLRRLFGYGLMFRSRPVGVSSRTALDLIAIFGLLGLLLVLSFVWNQAGANCFFAFLSVHGGPPETQIPCKTCTRPTRQFTRSNQCVARPL